MSDVDKILEDLLNSKRLKELATFTRRIYSDQPLIQTGKQMRERANRPKPPLSNLPRTDYTPDHPWKPSSVAPRQLSFDHTSTGVSRPEVVKGNVPERYYQLREIAAEQPRPGNASLSGALAYGTRSANRLFYEQARFMEDFEDDYEFHGTYSQYFPTYSSMTLNQLRGYFSWRTRVRHGEMPEAPLSFAFLYVYELLCGIGTTPGEQGLHDLIAFRDAYLQTDMAQGSTFSSYLRRWLRDYVVYHELDPALLPGTTGGMQEHVYTLLQGEEAALRAQKLTRKEAALEASRTPDDEVLMTALNDCSSYQICGARLYKDQPADVRFIACQTFRALAVHCAKRRKTDFVEGLFGSTFSEPYTMFSSAVFYEPEPHADASVRMSALECFTCREGRWRRHVLCDATSRSSELGSIMHAVDQRLREKLNFPYPLKERPVAAYVVKIIDKAIDELLAAKAEAERRRIDIDLSQLGHIRAAAAVSREALLTDDEREESTAPVVRLDSETPASPSEVPCAKTALESTSERDVGISEPSPLGLTDSEDRVLRALLHGLSAPTDTGVLLSLLVDSINEKLFDLVGDTVIEYVGDDPVLIEDYVEDVREIVDE
ncbi:MAG: TerB N-terminal domain-containing protein [Coriobacteriales bacterium]|nr:TerB N-terminal domain-containing protein [Coriobacteriales bacterium]